MVDDRTESREGILEGKETKTRPRSTYIKWAVFGLISFVALAGLITAIIVYEIHKNDENVFRVDCLPGLDINHKICMKRGCEWHSRNSKNIPACFFPEGSGYKRINEESKDSAYKATLQWTNKINFFFDGLIKEVSAAIYYETENRLRFQIKDPGTKRYEVPLELPPLPETTPKSKDYVVETTNDPQFGVQVRRKSTNTLIFDTNTPGTVFSDQYLQITIKLSTPYVFGFGEHKTETYMQDMNWRKWNLFSRDMGPFIDPKEGFNNLYGVHPFYMNVEKDGNAHGVLFLNSNAMEITLQPHPAITFRTIGGIFDFYIFMGPTPEDVVKQYLQLVGLPMMPTYWSLGFHLCRYGYKNLEEVRAVVERTTNAKIPLDVQYLDIDYMLNARDFSFDDENFKGLPDFAKELNAKNIKLGVILDPAIASNSTLIGKYKPLDLGLELDVFVKTENGSILEGEVWPGLTYYPDFSHHNALAYWYELCKSFRDVVHYDSMWIDMNEPSSFAEGSVNGCEVNKWNYPPFAAGVKGSQKKNKLFEKTICMDSVQAAGKHYDVHSLYGHFQAKVTYSALEKIYNGTRPVIIGRSTYSGTGKYAGHWLGDNRSWWDNLQDSIPGMMRFALFGIPYIGADICGFFDNATEEICARWSQLGAFYPFTRNHNAKGFRDQDPAAMGNLVETAAREALMTRYTLLPYLYTLFYYAHHDGSTVVRPLLHEFPNDQETYKISFQFLWGPSLLISPVVTEKSDDFTGYFPAARWYDFYTGKAMDVNVGKHISLDASWEKVNLHVREGWILPLQTPDLNTELSRKHQMQLFVAPDKDGKAHGSLFWDDGETLDTDVKNEYLMLHFSLSQNNTKSKLSIEAKENGYTSDLYFDKIMLCGQVASPKTIDLNGNKITSFNYEKETQVVHIHSLQIKIGNNTEITLTFS